jgi:hypothetical protein
MDIAIILSKKYPESEWVLNGDDYEGLKWISKTTKPTKKALEDSWLEMQEELKKKTDARTSALSKLAALGLTEEEIAAL